MIIGVPKEIKNHEYRVGMVPGGVASFVQHGHKVYVQKGAGEGAGFSDEEYIKAGAEILPDAPTVWGKAEMVVKVKEPIEPEYKFFRKGLILYTYLHLAPLPGLTTALMESGVFSFAYETIECKDGTLPLLKPMSEIAGRMSVQVGAHYLEKAQGGRGVMLGGVPGTHKGKVVIIGGGVVGTNAAKMAMGLGADTYILDVNQNRLEYLDDVFFGKIHTVYSNPYTVAEMVAEADLLVGGVLIPGAKAPHIVTKEMIASMHKGSVAVDVAIDQGGCFETSRSTSHQDPVYTVDGVIHYCVTNMPGALARTSTIALTNATLRYGLRIADMGPKAAAKADPGLALGINTMEGKLTYEAVAKGTGLPYTCLCELL